MARPKKIDDETVDSPEPNIHGIELNSLPPIPLATSEDFPVAPLPTEYSDYAKEMAEKLGVTLTQEDELTITMSNAYHMISVNRSIPEEEMIAAFKRGLGIL